MSWMNVVFWLLGTLVVMLGPIVLIHELAHFVFAKLAGVRVEEFGFGFPPRLLKLWRGEGYIDVGTARVKIPIGFRLPSELKVGEPVDALVEHQGDGTLMLRRLRLLDGTADGKIIGGKAEEDDEIHLRGPVTVLEPGTLYSLNLLPMGAFVKMTGEEDPSDPRSLAAQPKRWRLAVMAAGSVFNIIAALILLIGAYTAGFPTRWQVKVAKVEAGTPAEEAGLQTGDIVVAANGGLIDEGLVELREIVQDAPEEDIELVILRRGERVHLTATPRRQPEGHGFLGIMMTPWPDRTAVRRFRLPRAIQVSVRDAAAIIGSTLELPVRLIQGDVSSREARPTTMVGISQMMTFSLQQSIEWRLAFPALQTASLVSLALGLTNLLPVPGLDGGRIVFVLVEAVRGRRVPPEREAVIHIVGMIILVGLMLFVMFQDVFNPIIPWSWLK